ncbi:MAG: (Fe-S)-binding protein [Acidimicrobiia bacterium]|nr:(Fe-S)-binding protein [Acidimicrobiia bacterium]
MDLNIDPDELAVCVSCGLCLPHCPTYRVTGDDMVSPRGRISLMRAVQNDDAPLLDEVVRSMETCVQCRGCEPACPSGVPFGRLMEATRDALAEQHVATPRYQRLGMKVLGWPRVLRLGSSALAVGQRLRVVPSQRLGLPDRLPVRRRPHRPSGDDVHLFTGCVMDAWQRDVHHATQRVVESAGFGVAPSGDAAPCCGALHSHAGLTDDAVRLARQTMAGLAGDAPILVDSAGCGAALKDYGHLLGTDGARRFSARVYDIHEFLARHLDRLPEVVPLPVTVVIQDPCHLRHVQRAHEPVRTVLAPFVAEIRELDDDGLCCGAGGAYGVLEPDLAGAIRDRKRAAIDRAAADLVASANPGCSLHLAATGLDVRHPMELVAEALA